MGAVNWFRGSWLVLHFSRFSWSEIQICSSGDQDSLLNCRWNRCDLLSVLSTHARSLQDVHSQGEVIACLEKGLVTEAEEQPGQYVIKEDCKKAIMRVAELSSDDFHLDRHLYFACREDRERFCENVRRNPLIHTHCALLCADGLLCSFVSDSSRRRKGLQMSVQPQVWGEHVGQGTFGFRLAEAIAENGL